MIVTIHQPEHMPWPGLLHKISQADKFIILDTVQFRKNYFQNRNRICTCTGIEWLTLPIVHASHKELIRDKTINRTERAYKRWPKTLERAYAKCPFFEQVFPTLEEIHTSSNSNLVNFNLKIINFMLKFLEIDTPCQLASSLELDDTFDKTGINLEICRSIGASVYLSGPSGKDYLDVTRFQELGIHVLFHEYSAVAYKHPYPCYEPGVSFIDAMMLYGQEAREFLCPKP